MEAQAEAEWDDEQSIPPEAFVAAVTQADNLASDLQGEVLTEMSQRVIADFDMDKESMAEWFERMERGLKLAKLVKEDKDYPFKGAANIKYPLVTSAALQFNARAYPAIVPNDRVVMAKVWGNDEGGQKAARADRVSEFMSWQLTGQIPEWEEDTDTLLVQLPIVGTVVRKWWWDPALERPKCRIIEPGKFIVNDRVKTLADAPRVSEELRLYPSEIETRVRTGHFVAFEYDREHGATDDDEVMQADPQAPQEFIEQHTRWDLDEDGYEEPYVITVHRDTQTVVRVVADFREEDVSFKRETRQVPVQTVVPGPMGPMVQESVQQVEEVTGILGIQRGSYFVAHRFLPGIDGGFWGTGLGLLLGDISDTINTILNMLVDAGHFASLGGGFIGSELRMKGGSQRFRPGEYKMVGTTGQDVRTAIVDKTFPGPDATLFQMLGMLIEAGREIASVKDVVTGDSGALGKNASPTTTIALIEQGMMVFTAAYKRVFRSMKAEYGLLCRLNRDGIDAETYSRFHDEMGAAQEGQQPQVVMLDPAREFDTTGMDIQPVADPRSVTKMQQASKAELVMTLADRGMVDQGEALNRVAEAMDIPDVEDLMPQPDPMQEQMAMMQMQAAQADIATKMASVELTMAQVEETRAKAMKAVADAETDAAKVQNEQTKMRLDGLMKMLEEERERLAAVLRGPGGMAHASGDGSSARGNAGGGGTAEKRAVQQLLDGTPGAGGGQGGAPYGGAMG